MRRAVLIAGVLLATLAPAEAVHAGRLDDAAQALRTPGVWVDAELAWLLAPAAARRLERGIRAADVPVRVAVLPQLEVDESRGDPRAILRAIIRRVDRDGLYVLVDQDGYLDYAARRLPLDVELSYSGFNTSMTEALAGLVPAVRAARPAAPVSFEPTADLPVAPEGSVPRDSLVGVASGAAVIGGMLGIVVYLCLRSVVGAVGYVRTRRA